MKKLLPALLPWLAACGPAEMKTTPTVFIALARDFQAFDQWEHFDLPTGEITASPHTAGTRTVFLNARPAKGSTAFPVGTVIVKQGVEHVFAMAKRGGGYNSAGADGWEWFELKAATDGSQAIVWRGITPPVGEKYSGTSGGTCNTCHDAAKANDWVQSEPLRLEAL